MSAAPARPVRAALVRATSAWMLVAGLAGPVRAEEPIDQVVADLEADGYEVREVARTWLGRIRIEAESVTAGKQREVVFNRATGEILRDYASPIGRVGIINDGESRTASRTVASRPVAPGPAGPGLGGPGPGGPGPGGPGVGPPRGPGIAAASGPAPAVDRGPGRPGGPGGGPEPARRQQP